MYPEFSSANWCALMSKCIFSFCRCLSLSLHCVFWSLRCVKRHLVGEHVKYYCVISPWIELSFHWAHLENTFFGRMIVVPLLEKAPFNSQKPYSVHLEIRQWTDNRTQRELSQTVCCTHLQTGSFSTADASRSMPSRCWPISWDRWRIEQLWRAIIAH